VLAGAAVMRLARLAKLAHLLRHASQLRLVSVAAHATN
jgi:hypothetical protein